MSIPSLRPDGSLGFGNQYGEFRSLDWIGQVKFGQPSHYDLSGHVLHPYPYRERPSHLSSGPRLHLSHYRGT